MSLCEVELAQVLHLGGLVNIHTRQSGRQHTMLDMRQGKRTDLETALDVFGLPNGGAIQPASRCRDSLGTPYRRLPSIRPLPSRIKRRHALRVGSERRTQADPAEGARLHVRGREGTGVAGDMGMCMGVCMGMCMCMCMSCACHVHV